MLGLARGTSWLSFAGLAVGAAILVVLSLVSLRNYQSASDTTLGAAEVVVQEAVLLIRILEAQTAERGYLATQDETFREDFTEAKQATTDSLNALLQRDHWTQEQREALEGARAATQEHLTRLQGSVDLIATGDIATAIRGADVQRDQELLTEIQEHLAAIAAVEADQRNTAEEDADQRALLSAIGIVALAIVTASLAVWVLVSLRRQGAADSLRQANQAKDEVLAMLSHELRSPITIINGHVRLLRTRAESMDPAEREESLVEVEREAHRLDRMVAHMLTLSSNGTARAPELEPLRIGHLVDRAVERHAVLHAGSKVKVVCGDELPLVLADEDYIGQVIENLLSNAAKYGPPGAPIEVRARNQGPWVEVSVTDQGQGIAPELRERIFEPFVRAENGAGRREGLGIGLAVCRRLIRAQGGDVWVDASTGPGTTLTFRLAAIPVHESVSK